MHVVIAQGCLSSEHRQEVEAALTNEKLLAEREAFLAGLHVGVVSIAEEGRAPLSAPVWYDYTPELGVWLITGRSSRKGRLLESTGRYSLVAQTEA